MVRRVRDALRCSEEQAFLDCEPPSLLQRRLGRLLDEEAISTEASSIEEALASEDRSGPACYMVDSGLLNCWIGHGLPSASAQLLPGGRGRGSGVGASRGGRA